MNEQVPGDGKVIYLSLGSLGCMDVELMQRLIDALGTTEHRAVLGLVKFRFAGADALAALDRLTTRSTAGLAPGTVGYGVVLDERGLMLDEGTTFVVAPDEAYFFGNDEREPFVEHLERHTAGLDVLIENVTTRIPNIAIQGPGSYELVARLADVDVAGLTWFHLIPEPVRLAGVRGLLSRTGFTGEFGYEFFLLDPDGAEGLWDSIIEGGATPFGLDAVELLRVEAALLIQHEDYVPGEISCRAVPWDGVRCAPSPSSALAADRGPADVARAHGKGHVGGPRDATIRSARARRDRDATNGVGGSRRLPSSRPLRSRVRIRGQCARSTKGLRLARADRHPHAASSRCCTRSREGTHLGAPRAPATHRPRDEPCVSVRAADQARFGSVDPWTRDGGRRPCSRPSR
ncbi:MAG: hypothetical protein WEE66_01270 [Actinomycetota bacterium]